MVFASPIFLFLFLPLALAAYFCAGNKFRNLVLLLFSLAFYAWGEGIYLGVMLYSICITWFFGSHLENSTDRATRKRRLWTGVILILLPLLLFKYFAFIANNLYPLVGFQSTAIEPLHLPIGISFFTFQALSYLIDVYRSTASAQRSVWNLGLYISLFPQLIAGPIVRYQDIFLQLSRRVTTIQLFSSGVERFIYGLAKKVLIANPLGYVADICFGLPVEEVGVTGVWIGVICYSLQIYFDFSGYSDMAIGLGRMFGFKFAENFNYPYIAKSIQEFWRRWHISLSTWFRDYVYFPLGGSRSGNVKTMRNLLVVFLLCGFWHGASWNFMIWGLIHGAFLTFERTSCGQRLTRAPVWLRHIYVLLVVLVGWVFFRGDNLSHSIGYLSEMVNLTGSFALAPALSVAMDAQFWASLCVAVVLSAPAWMKLQQTVGESREPREVHALSIVDVAILSALLCLSIFEIAAGAYNPFIYFRF